MTPARPAEPDHTVRSPHPILDAYYEDEAAKRKFIREVFDAAAPDYDRVDQLLGLGVGSRYRRQALLRAGLAKGMRVLDVAVGTGLVARQIVKVLGAPEYVIGIDPSPAMMTSSGGKLPIRLIQGRAETLPFADHTFDFLSLGFALRHVADLESVFREFRRVLKPGGRVLLLEITRPEGRVASALLRMYMRGVVPALSRLVAKHPGTPRLYRYYWDTIEACAPPAKVLSTLSAVGFADVDRHVDVGIFSEYRGTA
jgi:demethylmenaquinone methyltransferase/2-methoxy-6-polyprenyl-1,4-benzoquinol methylase